jgi:hypothetical protein
VAVSTNEKKKESDLIEDSNSIPEDVLQALADATAEDEADFLDALSEDVDDEMHEKETVIDSVENFQNENSNSIPFPELMNEVRETKEKESPFDLSSPFSEVEGDEAPPAPVSDDVPSTQAEDEIPSAHDIDEMPSSPIEGSVPDLDDLQSFGSEDSVIEEEDNDLPPELGTESPEPEEMVATNIEDSAEVETDFLSHEEGSDVLSQDELDSLSDISADLDEAIAQSDFTVDEPSKVEENSPEIQATAEDHTEMLKEDEFPTMAVGQVKSDEAQGRNPLIDLKNADYIKFAQDKIKNLEKQLFDLRAECEELARAGDHFKNLAEDRGQKLKALESKLEELESLSAEEKKILQESISSKDLRISTMQEHIENLEQELESRYNRVRVRERDLEGRLEILKKEQSAVAKSKDEMILKLKSQNESLKADLEKVRAQSQKVTSHLQDKEDALRRTMKALKLSLTMLESQSKD